LAFQFTGLLTKGFYLWSHIKALIYSSPTDSEEDFIARIVKVAAPSGSDPQAATIRQRPSNFEYTRQSLLLRHNLYLEVGGHTFEHAL